MSAEAARHPIEPVITMYDDENGYGFRQGILSKLKNLCEKKAAIYAGALKDVNVELERIRKWQLWKIVKRIKLRAAAEGIESLAEHNAEFLSVIGAITEEEILGRLLADSSMRQSYKTTEEISKFALRFSTSVGLDWDLIGAHLINAVIRDFQVDTSTARRCVGFLNRHKRLDGAKIDRIREQMKESVTTA